MPWYKEEQQDQTREGSTERIQRTMKALFEAINQVAAEDNRMGVLADETLSAVINVLIHLMVSLPEQYQDDLLVDMNKNIKEALLNARKRPQNVVKAFLATEEEVAEPPLARKH